MPNTDSLPVTPRELTSALYDAGSLQQGSVVSVAITTQIETPISHLWFLEVVYAAGSSPALPDRLLLKWAIEESPAPDRGEPEIIFYRELAPALPSLPMIRCLATAAATSEQQWMLLEDLRASHITRPGLNVLQTHPFTTPSPCSLDFTRIGGSRPRLV